MTKAALTAAVAALLEEQPEVSASEVARIVGGRKRDVLKLVQALRAAGVAGTATAMSEHGDGPGTGSHSVSCPWCGSRLELVAL